HSPTTPTTYTLSLHDALPISDAHLRDRRARQHPDLQGRRPHGRGAHRDHGQAEAAAGSLQAALPGPDSWALMRAFPLGEEVDALDRKSTRLNSSLVKISYAVF